jgi:hypothetical protein
LSQARALDIDTKHGLSDDTYLTERGFDPDVEAANRQATISEGIERDTVTRQAELADQFATGERLSGDDTESVE